jgi:hypothetical protein
MNSIMFGPTSGLSTKTIEIHFEASLDGSYCSNK